MLLYFWQVKKENATAFDAVAREYDASFTETSTGRLQRAVVYAAVADITDKKGDLLEINCGTGADALWWAQQGWQVVASDISPEMVQVTKAKVLERHLEQHIIVLCADATDITQQLSTNDMKDRRFDVIFSNFGGVNCIAPEALPILAQQLKRLLKPGGQLIMVIMGRFCWWETLYFMAKGRFRSAFRRFSSHPVDARLDDDTTIKTWYYSPKQIQKAFSGFSCLDLQAVGCWLPPSYLDPLMKRFPGLLSVLHTLEKRCRGRFWAWSADHYLVKMGGDSVPVSTRSRLRSTSLPKNHPGKSQYFNMEHVPIAVRLLLSGSQFIRYSKVALWQGGRAESRPGERSRDRVETGTYSNILS